MAQNRKNDDFDLDRLDAAAEGAKSSAADGMGGFDIFNFSASDLDNADLGRVQDDLDLDSLLDFDNLSESESEDVSEPEEAAAPEPTEEELAFEQQRLDKRRERRERKEAAFAELFGDAQPVAEMASGTEADEPFEEEAEPCEPKIEQKRKREKKRKRDRFEEEAAFAAEPEAVEVPKPETESAPEMPDEQPIPQPDTESFEESFEEEYEAIKPKGKKRGRFARRHRDEEEFAQPDAVEQTVSEAEPESAAVQPENEAAESQNAAAEAPAETSEATLEDAAEPATFDSERASRRGFFARFLKAGEAQDEDDDAPLDEPDEEEKPSLLHSLFGRGKAAPNETEDEEQTFKADESDEAGEKPAGERISFFARLTPEKEKFQALMQAKKAEEKPARRADILPADNTSLARQLGRDPRRDEMLVYDSELDEISYIDRDDLPESRDYLPIRFRRYGKSGIGGGLMYAVFVISVSIILACFGWLCAADVLALSKDEISAVIVVESYVPQPDDTLNENGKPVDERGDVITCNIDQVATALKDGDIINFKFLFQLFAKLSHASAKIDPGTYDVSTKLDYRALITEMQTGSDSQEITKITFPEGYRMEQIFQLLEDNNICSYDDLMEQAANHNYSYSWLDEDWYYEAEGDPTRLEGYLFPDTYEFYQGENAINVINRFLLRFHGLLTQDMYQQADNLGISLHEAVIVASLIEKEAGANDDRSNFSSVIYNRLNAGWKLQLDSTINYLQNTSTFNISYADLETDSPYNTYMYDGLPKGPICNAGLASLNAALNPNSTNYWFWYAYDGSTYFFTNSSDFDSFAYEHPYD